MVGNLLRTVDEFLDLLVAVHNTPLGEAYQIMDTLRLMDFLKDMRKEDMFIRYVHQLVQVQLSSNNLVEAALSLKLHADLYMWDIHEKVPALEDPKFPEQTAFERREQLFLEMISYFEDGKSWENAAETYRELAEQYENTVFEYGKLARCQRAMAKLQETILEGQRVEPLFYRVAYYGLGFPVGLRDRQFIVQAGPYETLSMFSDRMLMQHPAARLVDGVVDEVEGQYIHVLPVEPDIDYTHPSFRKQRVPAAVREYVSRRDLRAFSIQHHRDEGEEGDQDEWDEKTVFLTAESFPTILKRSEVTGVHTLPVSPVSHAIRSILSRTKALQETERGYAVFAQPDKALDLSPLSLALSAAVDARTSVAGFRRLIEHADTAVPLREALKTVLADHVLAVKKALGTHGRLVTDGLRGVQAGCVKCFEATFSKELAEALPPPSLPVVGGAAAAAAAAVGQWRPQGMDEVVEVGRAKVASVVFGAGGQGGASGAGMVVKVNGVGGHGEKDPMAAVGKRGRKESSATVASGKSGRSSGRGSGRSASRGGGGGGGGKEDRIGVTMVVGAGGTGAGGEERKAGMVGKRVGSVRRRWSQLNLGSRKNRKTREGMGMEVAAVLEE
jgi:dedicator of cytokinesis protein 3